MFYYLFNYLDKMYDMPGAGMFNFISFRAGLAFMTALIFSTLVGKKIIDKLQQLQIGETIRDLDLEGQMSKKGTPTMGGIIILLSILVAILCFGVLHNVYMILMLITTIWLGALGFADDYIKVFRKNKDGLHGKFKIVGQVGIGLIRMHRIRRSRNETKLHFQRVVKLHLLAVIIVCHQLQFRQQGIRAFTTLIPVVRNAILRELHRSS